MKSCKKFLASILAASIVMAPFTVQSKLIATDEVVIGVQTKSSKDVVRSFVNRSDVASKLEGLGISRKTAEERVSSLTQKEAEYLAEKIDSLPAGGYISATGGVIIAVTLIIIVALTTRSR